MLWTSRWGRYEKGFTVYGNPYSGCGHNGWPWSKEPWAQEVWIDGNTDQDVRIVRYLPFGLIDAEYLTGDMIGRTVTITPDRLWCDCEAGG